MAWKVRNGEGTGGGGSKVEMVQCEYDAGRQWAATKEKKINFETLKAEKQTPIARLHVCYMKNKLKYLITPVMKKKRGKGNRKRECS